MLASNGKINKFDVEEQVKLFALFLVGINAYIYFELALSIKMNFIVGACICYIF